MYLHRIWLHPAHNESQAGNPNRALSQTACEIGPDIFGIFQTDR